MNLTDELRRLADLRAEGNLTDEEFVAAKHRLLSNAETGGVSPALTEEETAPAAGDAIPEKTYHSSRWSSGNLFFPDALVLAGDGLLFRKRGFVGSREEHINYKAVASVRVKNGLFLASLSIETTGGSQPVFINGLWKSDAREIQDVIRTLQRAA